MDTNNICSTYEIIKYAKHIFRRRYKLEYIEYSLRCDKSTTANHIADVMVI